MDSRERSILKTLLYADIFNFPLKKNEVWRFLIAKNAVSEKNLFKNIPLNKFIEFKNNYYFIKGRKALITLRKKREVISKIKINKTHKILKKISYFPTIQLIGISGALSMQNCNEEDDIDLFVITQKNFVWITRLVLVLSLLFLGVYRNKNSKKYKDKICLNMIVDEKNMVFDKKNQNLYTAHEIIQMIPLFEKNNIYKEFIKKNIWYRNFLINATPTKRIYMKTNSNFFDFLFINLLRIFFIEEICEFFQKIYMKKNITKETIRKGFLAFHPFNYESYVLKAYRKKLNKYKL